MKSVKAYVYVEIILRPFFFFIHYTSVIFSITNAVKCIFHLNNIPAIAYKGNSVAM